jgi:hypothetical protein
MTRFCSDTWTPGVDTLCWRALERLSVRHETRMSLQRMLGGDMSSALRELSRAGFIRAHGYGAKGGRRWEITQSGRNVLTGTPRECPRCRRPWDIAPLVAEDEPEFLHQAAPTRRADGTWLLGCGIHTSAHDLARCPACDAAHAATLAALDDGAIERRQRMTARTTLAMTRRQEAHGTTAGAQVPGYRPPQNTAAAERKAS